MHECYCFPENFNIIQRHEATFAGKQALQPFISWLNRKQSKKQKHIWLHFNKFFFKYDSIKGFKPEKYS